MVILQKKGQVKQLKCPKSMDTTDFLGIQKKLRNLMERYYNLIFGVYWILQLFCKLLNAIIYIITNTLLQLSEAVKKIKEDKRVVCVLGGDHSVGIGSIHGHMTSYGGKEEPCVLWVDAHADINTIKSSESGSMHGMPMSFHIKDIYKENKNLKHMEWFKPT